MSDIFWTGPKDDLRSTWVPPLANNTRVAEPGALGQQAAVAVAHSDRAPGMFWSTGQVLHAPDGTIVAHDLAQAGELLSHLGWINEGQVKWPGLPLDKETTTEKLIKAAKELGLPRTIR